MSDIAIHLKNAAGFGRKIEKAWLVVVAIFIGLAIFVPLQAEASFAFVAEALTGMAPFLALAIGVAAYARASGADNLIAKAFQGRMSIMIVFAALFGGMSPFCSCGVIPLIAALLAMGVPVPAVMAFWLASPLMDPTMFVLTAGTLSLDFAIAKTLAAVGIGMMGGFATATLMARSASLFTLTGGRGWLRRLRNTEDRSAGKSRLEVLGRRRSPAEILQGIRLDNPVLAEMVDPRLPAGKSDDRLFFG